MEAYSTPSITWNASEIWNNFLKTLQDQGWNKQTKDFYLHSVEYTTNVLHNLWIDKCEKLHDINTDIGCYLLCMTCNDLFLDPITLQCGHTYCRRCLEKREKDSYIELCQKCDKSAAKYSRWNFIRRNVVDKIHNNVILSSFIKENCPDELQAIHLRLEGNSFLVNKDLEKAAEKYTRALLISPSSFLCWLNLSQVRYHQNNYLDSLNAAQKSITIFQSWPKAYYWEGIAFKALSKTKESVLSFFKFLILNPASTLVKNLLVECLLKELEPNVNNMEIDSISPTHLLSADGVVGTYMKSLLECGIEFCLSRASEGKTEIRTRLSLDKLTKYLTCPLCCRIFYDVTTTPCGHSFCSNCLERSLDYNPSCPICRSPLNELITVKPKGVDEAINRLVVNYFKDEWKERELSESNNSEVLQFENPEDSQKAVIPIFVCLSVFPTIECPLHIFEPKYKLMIRRCLNASSKVFGMCMVDSNESFSDYGTLMEIKDSTLLEDGRLLVNTVGGKRFKVLERSSKDGYKTAKVEFLVDNNLNRPTEENEVLLHDVYGECKSFISLLPMVIQNTVTLKCGELPSIDEGATDEYGHKWVWYMLNLLVPSEVNEINRALKCNNLNDRLLLIKEVLLNVKDVFSNGSNNTV